MEQVQTPGMAEMERRQHYFSWRQREEEEQMAREYAVQEAYSQGWIVLVKVEVKRG